MKSAPTAKPDRRGVRIAQTRESILDGAARAFARHGYQASTMRIIAEESGYTAPSLYNYFEDKEEIVAALSERLGTALLTTLDDSLPDSLGVEQQIEILIRRWLEFSLRNQDALRAFLSLQADRGSLPKGLSQRQLRFYRAYIRRLATWMGERQAQGAFAGRSAEDLALFLWSTFQGFHFRWLEAGAPDELTSFAGLILDFFLNGAQGAARRSR